jgi:hypothetical protein
MSRQEHLAWAKERALEHVEAGDLPGAVASMTSDLMKSDDWSAVAIIQLAGVGMQCEIPRGAEAVRRWIEGFN